MPLGNEIQIKQISPQKNTKEVDFELIEPKYSLADILVSDETQCEINNLISLKKNHFIVFEKMGFSTTHKSSQKLIVNFFGEPGTGKTITAHAIAKEFGKKLLIVDYSQIESKYVGDTPKNLKKVFEFAKTENCLIFFDEADAILSKRVTNMQSSTDTSVNQTRSVMLNILNEFNGDVIFATNFISNYDSAFMRRISKHIRFNLPDMKIRNKLFNKYIPTSMKEIDFDYLAVLSEGLSAADIENATLMSAFAAASKGSDVVLTKDIELEILSIVDSKKSNANRDA